METKYAAMFASVQAGHESVTGLCVRLGISRKTYYKYRARFAAEGAAGLVPRSRRPLSNPGQASPAMVALIVRTRSVLAEEGWLRLRTGEARVVQVTGNLYGAVFQKRRIDRVVKSNADAVRLRLRRAHPTPELLIGIVDLDLIEQRRRGARTGTRVG